MNQIAFLFVLTFIIGGLTEYYLFTVAPNNVTALFIYPIIVVFVIIGGFLALVSTKTREKKCMEKES